MNSWRIGGDHHDTFSGNAAPATEGVIELFANKSSYAGAGGWNYGDMIYTGKRTLVHLAIARGDGRTPAWTCCRRPGLRWSDCARGALPRPV
jgi:hypothetical protein